MKTISDHIRQHLLKGAGILVQDLLPPLNFLRYTEWSEECDRLCRNRLLLGSYRYGLMNALDKPKYSRSLDIIQRMESYIDDGNLEHLIDVRNLAMLEFEEGTHPKRHFSASDDGIHTERR